MFGCLFAPSLPRDALASIARTFSPRIEIPEPSLVLLDISGLGRLLGEPRAIAEELHQALVRELAAREADPAGLKPATTTATTTSAVAIVGTRIAAQLLARAACGAISVIEPGRESAALAPLPLLLLGQLGAPPDLLATLDRWGLRTLGDFAALPAARLSSRVGAHGLLWQRAARGEDSRPLIPALVEERFEELLDLDWPIEGIEPLAFVLSRLLDPLCARLELRDRAVAAMELRLRFTVTRAWRMRRLELPAPMRDPRTLRTLLCLDLEGHPEILSAHSAESGTIEGLDRIGLFIEPTPGRIAQFSLLSRPTVAPEALATLMARLRALMGQDRCGTARLLDTHRPGAFAMAEDGPVPDRATSRTAVTTGRAVRRIRHPIPARVIVDQGRPVRVVTDRRGWNGGRVMWCTGPWRASGEWWNDTAYRWQEWDVALSDGGHYRVHEDRQLARWFINAILD